MSLYQKVRRVVVMVSLLIGVIVFMQASLTESAPADAITNEAPLYERPSERVAEAKRQANEEKWLGTKGGTLTFREEPVTLQAPSGAVREWIKMRLSDARIEDGKVLLEAFELTGRNRKNRTLSSFSREISLSISFEKHDTTDVAISWLNEKGQWQPLKTEVDREKKVATIKTLAVGTFALSNVESDGNTLPKDEPDGDSLWLTPKGDTLKFESKPIILDAPAEAVKEDVLLKLSTPEIKKEEGIVDVFQIETTNKEGKMITGFERSVTLVVYLEQYNINKAILARLSEDGKWEELPTTINTDERVVKAPIDSTGTFALLKTDSRRDMFWLTQEGGRFEFASKPVILDVPQGAVREPVLLSLSVNRPALDEDIFDSFTLEAINGDDKPLTKFQKNITLMASFSEYQDQIPEHRKAGLYKATEKKWEYIPSKISPTSPDLPPLVYVEVNHLGTFGMGLAPIEPTYGAQGLPTINGFGNDEFSGNSSVHYPFSLPPTPGGIPFNLGLSYSSESANSIFAGNLAKIAEELHPYKRQAGIVGWGWNLSGLGSITRESTGDRRVFLSYAGGRFELKSSGYREWQTEPQAFLKIHSNSNATHNATQWWVWTPDGTRYTFGSPDWGQGVAYNRDILGDGCPERFRSAHLTEIRDVHGNHIDISYNVEERNVGCSDSIPDLPYTRAIYPQEIKYFPANQVKDTARIFFHYEEDRTDTHVEGYDEYYAQSLWSESRLIAVTAEVRQNDSSYDLSRRYTLEQDYDPNNEMGLYVMRLEGISDHGTFPNDNHDPHLPPWTFDYAYLEPGAQNTTVLQFANNGQGGGVEYQYDKKDFLIVPCEDEYGNDAATYRHYVKQKIISDGVGNQTIIDYNLEGSAWAYGDGWDSGCIHHFEFGGYGQVQRSVTYNEIVEQKVQTQYHQLVTGDNQNHPSHLSGLSKLQITLDANNTELQRAESNWKIIPQTHGTDWAQRDRITTTIDGVTNVTVYSYESERQDGEQYGNVTLLQQYMNAEASGTPYRTHETLFYPRDDAFNPNDPIDPAQVEAIRYIVNRPAQQLLWAGNVGQTCQGNSLIYYDENLSHQPTNGLVRLTKVANAEADCFATEPESWSETSYTYDDWGNQTSVTDPNGNTATTTYDTDGDWPSLYAYPESVTTPPNGSGTEFTTQYTWDKYLGQITLVKDPNHTEQNPVVTNYRYDQWGRLQKMWKIGHNENEPTQRLEYHNYVDEDAPFKVKQEQRSDNGSPATYIEAYTFVDGLGREIQTRSLYIKPDPDNPDQYQERHAVTFMQYNGLGQPSEVFAPIEQDASATYLDDGWDVNRPHTSSSYDALGRVLDVTQPDGSLTVSRYGSEEVGGQSFFKHSVIDGNRHRKRSRIDALGRTHSVVEQIGNCGNFEPGFECAGDYTQVWSNYAITTYQYNVKDQLTDVFDADGNQTAITYDLAGRKTQMNDPDMGQWHYDYDAAGNLTHQTDARGQRLCFYYDGLNRLTSKTSHSSANCSSTPEDSATYFYDWTDGGNFGIGRRTAMSNSQVYTRWKYDERGRVVSEIYDLQSEGTFATQWSYDALDRVRTMTYPDDDEGNLGEEVSYHYETLHDANLTTVQSDIGSGTAYATNMKYNVYGQLTSFEHRRSAPIKREYQYYGLNTENGLGRLQKIMTTAFENPSDQNPQVRQHLEYSYDAVGNVMSITDIDYDYETNTQTTQTQQFSYDELDRLLTAQASDDDDDDDDNGNYSKTYGYDKIGNMYRPGQNYDYEGQSADCDATALNQPHAVVSQGLDSYCYDANGNMQQRLEGHTNPNGLVYYHYHDYHYNPENRLNRVEIRYDESHLDQAFNYYYDGDGNRVKVEHTVGGNSTTIYIGKHVEWNVETGTMTKYYYANGQRIAMREGNSIYYPLTDHLGSTSVTLNYDENGTQHSELRYMPFGENRFTDGDTPTQRHFTGQIEDSSTGLYFYNARYYDPMLGRFIQPDSIVPEPGNPQAFNRYSYVYNNPVRYTDPTGHYVCSSHSSDGEGTDYCYGVYIDPEFNEEEINLIIETFHTYADFLGGEQAFFRNMSLDRVIKTYKREPTFQNPTYNKALRTISLPASLMGSYVDIDPDNPDQFVVVRAHDFPPGASQDIVFKVALAHEMTHGLVLENQDIVESFVSEFWEYRPRMTILGIGLFPKHVPKVNNISTDRNAPRDSYHEEVLADAVAAHLFAPTSLGNTYTNWINHDLPFLLR